jgi:hypothetical protein
VAPMIRIFVGRPAGTSLDAPARDQYPAHPNAIDRVRAYTMNRTSSVTDPPRASESVLETPGC